MGENQVHPAVVYGEGVGEVLYGHEGVLNVPGWAGWADVALPKRFTILGRLPQNEIAGVGFVVFIGVNARAHSNASEIVVRELAILGKFRDAVVSGTVAPIGEAASVQVFNRRDHFGDMVSGLHHALGPLQAQRGAVLQEGLRVALGVFGDRFIFGGRVANDLVLDVGDVHDVVQLITGRPQPSAQNVLEREGSKIADVRVVVDGGSASIHAHGGAVERHERLQLLGEGVVETQCHFGG